MEFQKTDVGGQNRGQRPRELRRVYRHCEGGNQWHGLFCARNGRFRLSGPNRLPIRGYAYHLGHDRPCSRSRTPNSALPRTFRPRCPEPPSRPPADQLNGPWPSISDSTGVLEGPEGAEILAGKRVPTAPTRSRWPMPAPVGHFVPQLATAAPSCSQSHRQGRRPPRTSSSRDRDQRRSRAAATAAPRWVRSGANTRQRGDVFIGHPHPPLIGRVTSGERVSVRPMLPGAVSPRRRKPHPRRHLQFFAARGDTEGVRQLAATSFQALP